MFLAGTPLDEAVMVLNACTGTKLDDSKKALLTTVVAAGISCVAARNSDFSKIAVRTGLRVRGFGLDEQTIADCFFAASMAVASMYESSGPAELRDVVRLLAAFESDVVSRCAKPQRIAV